MIQDSREWTTINTTPNPLETKRFAAAHNQINVKYSELIAATVLPPRDPRGTEMATHDQAFLFQTNPTPRRNNSLFVFHSG
jgi:hypothetical protein